MSDWLADADATRALGASNRRWTIAHLSDSVQIRTVSGETNPKAKLSDNRLEFGAGGASALDVNLYRSGADILKTDDTFDALALRIGGTTVLTSGRVLQNVTADAGIITSGVFASARIPWTAIAASIIPNTEFLYDIGSKAKPWMYEYLYQLNINTDINQTYPVARLSSSGLEFGAGGASALDVRLYRSAADVLKTPDAFQCLSLAIGTTTVIDSSRNILNILALTMTGVFTNTGTGDRVSIGDTNKKAGIWVGGTAQGGADPYRVCFRSIDAVTDVILNVGGTDFLTCSQDGKIYLRKPTAVLDDMTITNGKKIQWSDVNLYRSAADVLKTDDRVKFAAGPDDFDTYGDLLLAAGATWNPPRGFWVIITTSDGQKLQVYTVAWYTSYVSFAGGLVAFDGTNVRFYNSTGAYGYYYWRQWYP